MDGILAALSVEAIGGGAFGRVSGISAATAITAGDGHACAIVNEGEVWCWGISCDSALDGEIPIV